MDFLFRKPEFPALVDVGSELIAVRSWAECESRLEALSLSGPEARPVIDATAEGFAFHPELNVITPLTVEKNWTKTGIIALYNARKRPGAPTYAPKLGSRTLAAVVADIASLLCNDRAASPG